MCEKVRECKKCGAVNGKVKKIGAVKLVHQRVKAVADSKVMETVKHDTDSEAKKCEDDLHALRVLELSRKISPADCELLGLDPDDARPENFIWQTLPASPACIRPSVGRDNESTEDDLTAKLRDIIQSNQALKSDLARGVPILVILESWEYLTLQVAMYYLWPDPRRSEIEPGSQTHPRVYSEAEGKKREIQREPLRKKGRLYRSNSHLSRPESPHR